MIKATIIAPESAQQSAIDAVMRKAGPGMEIEAVIGGANQLAEEIGRHESDLIVAQTDGISGQDRQSIEQMLNIHPETPVVLICNDHSSEFLLWAMRAGITEVIPAPADKLDLLKAVLRQLKRRASTAGTRREKRIGSVYAFLAAKGGSGATFLATSAAAALAERGKKVALLDLNLHLGDAALFICDEPAERSIADVATDVERLDADLVQASLMQAGENLWVLPAPESPEAGIEVQPEAVEKLIGLLRERFDAVVIDTGRVLDARSICGLDAADTIFMVMQLALPYVHDAKRLKKVFDGLGYPAGKLRPIVNRFERGTDVSVRDVEKALGCEVTLKVPNDFKTVTYSINHAVPVFSHKKRSPVTESVFELADRMAPETKKPSRIRNAIGFRPVMSLSTSRG